MKYTDPTGMFDWDTNTIVPGDTLSQIALECNKKYGTDYTADDLQDLNSDTISDKDKIFAGNHLNLGKAENVQKRAADYANRATIQYSNEQLTYKLNQNKEKWQGVLNGTIDCLCGAGAMYAGYTIASKSVGIFSGAGYLCFVEGWTTFNYGIAEIGSALCSNKCLPGSHNLIIEQASYGLAETDFDKKRNK